MNDSGAPILKRTRSAEEQRTIIREPDVDETTLIEDRVESLEATSRRMARHIGALNVLAVVGFLGCFVLWSKADRLRNDITQLWAANAQQVRVNDVMSAELEKTLTREMMEARLKNIRHYQDLLLKQTFKTSERERELHLWMVKQGWQPPPLRAD